MKTTGQYHGRCQKSIEDVTNTGRIVQIGTQRGSADNYINAAKFIQEGKSGDIKFVDISWNVNQPLRWRQPTQILTKVVTRVWVSSLLSAAYEKF